MLFNSTNFVIFLPVVFILFWTLTRKNLRAQNVLLLIASYFFYACWDWRFLFLLVFSTALDYFTGLKIGSSKNSTAKNFWFWLSIAVNLGFLGVFKYYNFFAESFAVAVSNFGLEINPWTLSVILPIGISFYTFHGLSYVIDIYKDRITPEQNFIDYSLFVSFFPLLVAGPIERATHLLPQIKQPKVFNYRKSVDGLRQILWGLFKKVVIADNCAKEVDIIFSNYAELSGSTLVVGAVLFAFQIYGDFSGYSDIALGTARLFGIELLRNFAYPYFSRDIAEFWRRWHISLSTWFRDYLYIPLGGNTGGIPRKVINTFIIFLVSGFWHGASWTFIAWGFVNALFIMPSIILKTNRNNMEIVAKGSMLPSFKEASAMLITFGATVFAWIFFRSESIGKAIHYISGIISRSLFSVPSIRPTNLFVLILLFIIVEWFGREEQFAIAKLGLKWPRLYRYGFYFAIIFSLLWFGGVQHQFIYFQF